MKKVYLSPLAGKPLTEYLTACGYEIVYVKDYPSLGIGVSSHPDLTICKTGAYPDSPLITASSIPEGDYPENAAYCAVLLDKYVIHRLDITSPDILKYSVENHLTQVNIRQGYAKCGMVVVDGSSVITSDAGIISALSEYKDINVLAVSPENVELPGFPYGFLGGASGRVGDEIVFNGDLSAHPDFGRIRGFIESRGLSIRYFSEYKLTDIGSIIEYSP